MASSSLPASFNSSALASSLPRPSSAHPHPSQDDIKNELQDHIRNLHSQDQNVVAKAAAAIVMLATVSSAENYLSPAGKQLSLLLVTSESILVQRNACAALSAIMNSSFQNYTAIVQLPSLGIIPKFVRKLKADSTEICVRVLLGLGMLCGSSQEAQQQLAETDGAISMLLSLMKSSDPDIRAITHDLFASLSSSSYVKQKIEQFLRETTH